MVTQLLTCENFNPYVTSGFIRPCQLGDSMEKVKGIWIILSLFHCMFVNKFMWANSRISDQTLHTVASDMVLHWLPFCSTDAGLIWINLGLEALKNARTKDNS